MPCTGTLHFFAKSALTLDNHTEFSTQLEYQHHLPARSTRSTRSTRHSVTSLLEHGPHHARVPIKTARRSYEHSSHPSPRKRKHANGVGAEAEDNGLSPKTPKVTDETKEAAPKVQFGTVEPVDTAGDTAAEKGITRVREGEGDKVGGLTTEEMEAAVEKETKEAEAEAQIRNGRDGRHGGRQEGRGRRWRQRRPPHT